MTEEGHRLDVQQDLRLQQRQWMIERMGLVVMGAIAVAAILGVLGTGPLANATAGSDGHRLSVDYERFIRFGAPTELNLKFTDVEGKAEVSINEAFLEGFDVEGIIPQPDSQTVDAQRLRMSFSELHSPASVSISLTPREIGVQRADIAIPGQEPISFSQLVYP